MARDQTWLTKLKSHISHKLAPKPHNPPKSKSPHVSILAFEIAALISKLIALHHSLSDASILRLKTNLLSSPALLKLVSDDHSFLLSLAAAEIIQTLRLISHAVTRLSSRCSDTSLRAFSDSLLHFADAGVDSHGWAAGGRDVDAVIRRADRLISATSALYREMEELTLLENSLNKKNVDDNDVVEIQQKIVWQKQEIRYVKEKSLWNRSFDSVVYLSANLIFTIVARIKLVFAIENTYAYSAPVALPRSLSAGSATVFPSVDLGINNLHQTLTLGSKSKTSRKSFFVSRTKVLTPAANTLGASALALHYSSLIIIIEKMIKSPHLVGLDAREDLYSMLPSTIRSALRSRLKGVGFTATDPSLASEWRGALSRILTWLTPLAHNMIKWQSERSFEHHNLMPKSNNVYLAQTMFFANKEKTEAAISELLVGLNYIWRFEREMNAKAFLKCSNFFSNNDTKLQT